MKEHLIKFRNSINRLFYKTVLKNIFFRIDPEKIHDTMISFGEFLGSYSTTRGIISLLFSYSNKKLEQNMLGITFSNPIGLAAGFDKDAQLTSIIPEIGFGFAEVGSITGESCEGNPKPRLWRLKKSKSLVVYYGLKNKGSEIIAKNLGGKTFKIPIGTSIAKTNNKKTTELNAGIADYVKAYAQFTNIGSYFTINISCPNAFGGQPFTKPLHLNLLLGKISRIRTKKPIFLKLSPDLKNKEIDRIIKVAEKHNVNGFICTNLTKKRSNTIIDKAVPEKGGISGKIINESSNDLISYVYQKTKGKLIIIGCGGVFSAEDAYKKIKSGASLIQLITGMIFEGPQLISEINQGLVKLLEKDGFKNISEARGAHHRALKP